MLKVTARLLRCGPGGGNISLELHSYDPNTSSYSSVAAVEMELEAPAGIELVRAPTPNHTHTRSHTRMQSHSPTRMHAHQTHEHPQTTGAGFHTIPLLLKVDPLKLVSGPGPKEMLVWLRAGGSRSDGGGSSSRWRANRLVLVVDAQGPMTPH